MGLCEELSIRSFQLWGNELALVTPDVVERAGRRVAQARAAIPAVLAAAFDREQRDIMEEACRLLSRHDRSLQGRIRGYLELGERCRFVYPWPVVAILGICQVMTGFARSRVYGLVGGLGRRFAGLGRLSDGTDDVLRRTNRGIFVDSVPTVLYAIRCAELTERGDGELAQALLTGPLPAVLDEESRAIANRLVAGLAERDPARRFRALADLTLEHFAREQAIFTYQLGAATAAPPRRSLLSRLSELRSVPAPIVDRSSGRPRIAFRPFPLSRGFDIRDHAARVRELGGAFVSSVTGSQADYQTAVDYVRERFRRGQ
jgi:hypothetical protein